MNPIKFLTVGALLTTLSLLPCEELRADIPDEGLVELTAGEDIQVPGNRERQKWLAFTAEQDGALIVATHDSSRDLTIDLYSQAGESDPTGRVDGDRGNTGNELTIIQVNQGETYYFCISPFDSDDRLPDHFRIMCSFIPGITLQTPFHRPRPRRRNRGDGEGVQILPLELEQD